MTGVTVDGAQPVTAVKSQRYLITSVIEAHGNWGDDFEKVVEEQLRFQIGRIGGGRMGNTKLRVVSMMIQPGGLGDPVDTQPDDNG